jgi:hypothetical protein
MAPMRTRKRATGDQDIRTQPDRYRAQVWRKISAYHRFIQLGCIAHGLLQHLSIRFGPEIWHRFRSWLRTMDPDLLPSEQLVGQALRNSLPEFLADSANTQPFAKFLTLHQTPELIGCCRCASG